jgi:hypothetical protein
MLGGGLGGRMLLDERRGVVRFFADWRFLWKGRVLRERWLLDRLGLASDGSERLALRALDFGRVGAAAALQLQVLADGVIE